MTRPELHTWMSHLNVTPECHTWMKDILVVVYGMVQWLIWEFDILSMLLLWLLTFSYLSIDDTIPIIWVNLAFITNYRETYNYCTKKLKWTDFKLLSPYNNNNVTVEWLCFQGWTGLQQLALVSYWYGMGVKETVTAKYLHLTITTEGVVVFLPPKIHHFWLKH